MTQANYDDDPSEEAPLKGPPVQLVVSDKVLRTLLSGQPAIATGRLGTRLHDVHLRLAGITLETVAIMVKDLSAGRAPRHPGHQSTPSLRPNDPGEP